MGGARGARDSWAARGAHRWALMGTGRGAGVPARHPLPPLRARGTRPRPGRACGPLSPARPAGQLGVGRDRGPHSADRAGGRSRGGAAWDRPGGQAGRGTLQRGDAGPAQRGPDGMPGCAGERGLETAEAGPQPAPKAQAGAQAGSRALGHWHGFAAPRRQARPRGGRRGGGARQQAGRGRRRPALPAASGPWEGVGVDETGGCRRGLGGTWGAYGSNAGWCAGLLQQQHQLAYRRHGTGWCWLAVAWVP